MEKVYELAYELKDLLSKDERILNLDVLEKKLEQNEEAMALSYKKDLAVDEYEFALNHFGENSKEVETAQKKMHEAKLALDSCPVVKEYLSAYSKVRDLYMEINEILFSFLNQNMCDLRGN